MNEKLKGLSWWPEIQKSDRTKEKWLYLIELKAFKRIVMRMFSLGPVKPKLMLYIRQFRSSENISFFLLPHYRLCKSKSETPPS